MTLTCARCHGTGDRLFLGFIPIGVCPECNGAGYTYILGDSKPRREKHAEVPTDCISPCRGGDYLSSAEAARGLSSAEPSRSLTSEASSRALSEASSNAEEE